MTLSLSKIEFLSNHRIWRIRENLINFYRLDLLFIKKQKVEKVFPLNPFIHFSLALNFLLKPKFLEKRSDHDHGLITFFCRFVLFLDKLCNIYVPCQDMLCNAYVVRSSHVLNDDILCKKQCIGKNVDGTGINRRT